MEEVVSIISNIGFPIGVAIWALYTSREDSQKWCEAINRNTQVMQKLIDRLGGGADDHT